MTDIYKHSLELHDQLGGKLEVRNRLEIRDKRDLSLVYTPGVAEACREIARHPDRVYDLTIKQNTVAIVTDGSAVLGLGNIGPAAALPVMEGKAMLFKEYAGIDAFPICLDTQDTDEIIRTVRHLTPGFGGINLEDISAPRCFEIEQRLQNIGIPVFHDDQHGTAIVLLGALLNALKISGKKISELTVCINGAGAAGTAIAELLLCVGHDLGSCESVKDVIICDSKGIIAKSREDIRSNPHKLHLAKITNRGDRQGSLKDAIRSTDVFIGVSLGNLVDRQMVREMNPDPVLFAMANPVPEIMPEEALAAGALVVGTGRSDLMNQVNNVLAFPGIFKGTLEARAPRITNHMKLRAAFALAECVPHPKPEMVIPSPLDKSVASHVALQVKEAWEEEVRSGQMED